MKELPEFVTESSSAEDQLDSRGKPPPKPAILIVDDDEEIRTQMKWALAAEYTVHMAGDRASALVSPSGSESPVSVASRSSAIVSTSRYELPGFAAWISGSSSW